MNSDFSLSSYEKDIVIDAELLIAKNNIIKKVIGIFSEISSQYVLEAKNLLPDQLTQIPPKISKGDQYLGLPYVMLDYPRNFSKENAFAIRTFFWWGNFFSIHIQLSGAFQKQFSDSILTSIQQKVFDGWYIGINEDEWHHHFEENNYRPINNGTNLPNLQNLPVIKLAKKIPLKEWENLNIILKESFISLLKMCNS